MTRPTQEHRTPPAAGGRGPAPRRAGFDHSTALRMIALGVLGHMLRSRRLYERLAVSAIAVAALSKLGQENRAKAFVRMAAWVKREEARLERKAKAALP